MIVSSASPLQAAILLSGNPALGTGRLEITAEMTFEIVAGTGFMAVVFDEWVASDGTPTTLTPLTPDELRYRINSGPLQSAFGLALVDNQAPLGDVGPNDGFLALTPASAISVSIGDFVTLPVQSWDLPTGSGFNPAAIGTFSGEVFLADSAATRITAPAIPEPQALAVVLLSAACLAFSRRRQRLTGH